MRFKDEETQTQTQRRCRGDEEGTKRRRRGDREETKREKKRRQRGDKEGTKRRKRGDEEGEEEETERRQRGDEEETKRENTYLIIDNSCERERIKALIDCLPHLQPHSVSELVNTLRLKGEHLLDVADLVVSWVLRRVKHKEISREFEVNTRKYRESLR